MSKAKAVRPNMTLNGRYSPLEFEVAELYKASENNPLKALLCLGYSIFKANPELYSVLEGYCKTHTLTPEKLLEFVAQHTKGGEGMELPNSKGEAEAVAKQPEPQKKKTFGVQLS